jgi:hypothetical protein
MLNYFKIVPNFSAFKGQVKAICDASPDGRRPPYYVIETEGGQLINLAVKQTLLGAYKIGEKVSIKPKEKEKGYYPNLVLDFNIPQPIHGKVKKAETFLLGPDLFFSHLLIANGKGVLHVAFRPFRNQKHHLGPQLLSKPVIIQTNQLLVVKDGKEKKWPN